MFTGSLSFHFQVVRKVTFAISSKSNRIQYKKHKVNKSRKPFWVQQNILTTSNLFEWGKFVINLVGNSNIYIVSNTLFPTLWRWAILATHTNFIKLRNINTRAKEINLRLILTLIIIELSAINKISQFYLNIQENNRKIKLQITKSFQIVLTKDKDIMMTLISTRSQSRVKFFKVHKLLKMQ